MPTWPLASTTRLSSTASPCPSRLRSSFPSATACVPSRMPSARPSVRKPLSPSTSSSSITTPRTARRKCCSAFVPYVATQPQRTSPSPPSCTSSPNATTWASVAAGTWLSTTRAVAALPCNSTPTTSTVHPTPCSASWTLSTRNGPLWSSVRTACATSNSRPCPPASSTTANGPRPTAATMPCASTAWGPHAPSSPPYCAKYRYPIPVTARTMPWDSCSAAATASGASTTNCTFAAVGKGTAMLRSRPKPSIATTSTRTACAPWKSVPASN